jgi:hypothetical protein
MNPSVPGLERRPQAAELLGTLHRRKQKEKAFQRAQIRSFLDFHHPGLFLFGAEGAGRGNEMIKRFPAGRFLQASVPDMQLVRRKDLAEVDN